MHSSITRSLRCSRGGDVCPEGGSHRTSPRREIEASWRVLTRETGMFKAEACWLRYALDAFPAERLTPLREPADERARRVADRCHARGQDRRPAPGGPLTLAAGSE